MKYILDFDRTLFDTDKFITQLKLDNFTYDVLVPEMLQGYSIKDFLYDDVVSFLENKDKKDVIILSALGTIYGDRIAEYQKAKVEQEPIVSLVSDFYYVENIKGEKAAEIAKQFPPHEQVVFVDDRLDQCEAVKESLPNSQCFLMVRDELNAGDIESPLEIPVVHRLADVDVIINGL